MTQEQQEELFAYFTNHQQPIYQSNSLHVWEGRYILDGKQYTVFTDISGNLLEVEEYKEPVDHKAIMDAYYESKRPVKKWSVTFEGFDTEKQALEFAQWYSHQGEQESAVWLEEHTDLSFIEAQNITSAAHVVTVQTKLHKKE